MMVSAPPSAGLPTASAPHAVKFNLTVAGADS